MLQAIGKAERREYRSFLREDEVCLLGVKMFQDERLQMVLHHPLDITLAVA